MKRTTLLAYLVTAVSLVFAAGGTAQDETAPFVDANGDGINDVAEARHSILFRAFHQVQHEMRGAVGEQLTDEQKAELRELTASLREQDMTREDVRAAVTERLIEFGVTLPENWGLTPEAYADQIGFTEERRIELRALVESLKGDGFSREEVREAVDAQLAEWGIELPEAPAGEGGRRPPRGPRHERHDGRHGGGQAPVAEPVSD